MLVESLVHPDHLLSPLVCTALVTPFLSHGTLSLYRGLGGKSEQGPGE